MDTKLAINGILNETLGKRDQALADLQVLFSNAVGVGEHSSISADIKLRLEAISEYDSLVETITRYTTNPSAQTPQAETAE